MCGYGDRIRGRTSNLFERDLHALKCHFVDNGMSAFELIDKEA